MIPEKRKSQPKTAAGNVDGLFKKRPKKRKYKGKKQVLSM
jgi:hypothetical protein